MHRTPDFRAKFYRKYGILLPHSTTPMQTEQQALRRVRGNRGRGIFGFILRIYDALVTHFEDKHRQKRLQAKAARHLNHAQKMLAASTNHNSTSGTIRQTSGIHRRTM